MPQDEADVHNFSTSSQHKLPALTGAQALQEEIRRARGIPTNLANLDHCLSPKLAIASNGIRRGFVTEVYGPPGAGKTTFGIQLAVNAIHCLAPDSKAVWISASSPLNQGRVRDLSATYASASAAEPASSPPLPKANDDALKQSFIYRQTQSLPHLLVLLMHTTASFPPPKTAILVLDGLSNLLLGTFPRQSRNKDAGPANLLQDNAAKRANSKRFQLIENVASALSRLAASRHIAVVVLNNTTTAFRGGGQKALLKPSLGGQAWDAAVNTRVVLYRDFVPQEHKSQLDVQAMRGYRVAEVTRLGAKDVYTEPVPFVIEKSGLRALDLTDPADVAGAPSLSQPAEVSAVPAVDCEPQYSQPPSQRQMEPSRQSFSHIIPTASQVLAAEVSQTQKSRTTDKITGEENERHSTTVQKKRKATEIADSEDEGEGDDLLRPETESTVKYQGSLHIPTERNKNEPEQLANGSDEEMLFETHERRLKEALKLSP
jgi:RecA/RadA recombinase